MPRRDRLWCPFDVDFWDQRQVVAAGEPAGVLYQRLCMYALRNENDGWVPVRQPRAWYDDWEDRLDALVRVGLITYGPVNIAVLDWPKWHEQVTRRKQREERRRESDRVRQQRRRERRNALVVEEQEPSTSTRTASRDSHVVSHGVTPRVTRPAEPGPVARVVNAAALADTMFGRTGDTP